MFNISQSIFALFTLLLIAFPLMAQSTSSTINGVIKDETGAVINGAFIKVINKETERVREITSDINGNYIVAGLPTGEYQITVSASGFTSAERDSVQLTVADEHIVNFNLIVGVQDILGVEVTADPLIDRSSATLSGLVDEKKIRDLPLNGRDLAQLILLQPGVVNSRGSVQSGSSGRGTRFSVSGARPGQNLFTLDGTNINDSLNNTPGSAQGLLIGVETIKEFRVLTNSFSAEYGRAAGGVFVAVTKSGSNELHGSLFEFLRNDVFDARNFFDRDKPAFRRNQFGGTLGGSIIKNRLFYFGSYEGLREYKGISRVALVPDDNARRGIIAGQDRINVDPRSLPILELFPAANGENFFNGTAESTSITDRISNNDFFTVRVDANLGKNDSIFFRYQFEDSDQVLPRNFAEFPNLSVNRKQIFTLEEKKIISNKVINEFRFGFNRNRPSELVPPTQRALQLITGQDLGEISITGLSEVGTDRTNPKVFTLNSYQVTDNLIVIAGKHSLKMGFSFERFQFNGSSESRTRGQLRFRSLSDLLKFKVRDIQGATLDSDFNRGFRQSLFSLYLQDSYRVTSRLNLSLGLRYEYVTSPDEVNGKLSNLLDINDSEVTVGGPLFKPSKNNFAPRVGFALDITGDEKTILRGGFGLYYEQPLFQIYRNLSFRSLPFVNRGSISGITALPVDPSLFKGAEISTESVQQDLRATYLMQYNLNLQREFFNTVFSVAYIGSRGINLFGQGDLNTAIPVILADGREFFPEDSERRNSKFDAVRGSQQGFNSYYHALSVGAQKRLNRGLQFQLAYTYGKSIDERSGVNGRQEYNNGQARSFDPYNRRLDRARSDFDIRHSFTFNANYELPFGRNLNGFTGLLLKGWQVNTIVTLSSGVPFTPLIEGDPDRDASEDNASRPDVVPGVSFTPTQGASSTLWFNPAAFQPSAVGFRGNAGRNILNGPNFKTVDISMVKSITWQERFTIQFRFEAFNIFNRANFDLPSNTENGASLFTFVPGSSGRPDSFMPTPGLGRIFNTIGDSRELQFALKFIF